MCALRVEPNVLFAPASAYQVLLGFTRQFNYFTSTRVQIMTPEELALRARPLPRALGWARASQQVSVFVLNYSVFLLYQYKSTNTDP
jgi:hypothetical protein